MTYTPEKLRELDAWIAEHVMGWKKIGRGKILQEWKDSDGNPHFIGDRPIADQDDCNCWMDMFNPTTDPAASDALDDKILEKLGEDGYQIWHDGKNFIMCRRNGLEPQAKHLDKKICRALFAQRLFSK